MCTFFGPNDLENYMNDSLKTFGKRSVRFARRLFSCAHDYGTRVRVVMPAKRDSCALRRCLMMMINLPTIGQLG